MFFSEYASDNFLLFTDCPLPPELVFPVDFPMELSGGIPTGIGGGGLDF